MPSDSTAHYAYVVLGGGNAAGYCAKKFVEQGAGPGKLCILTSEPYVSYERPALSKGYLFPAEKNPPRLPGFHTSVGGGGVCQDPQWYEDNGIDFKTNAEVVGVDVKAKKLTTKSGDTFSYDNLVVATGASPLTLTQFGTPNADAANVLYLRDVADADALVAQMRALTAAPRDSAPKVVVVGGGYIGMECAAALVLNGLQVTMVFPEDHVMPRLFTPSIASYYEDYYKGKGVEFIKGDLVKGFTKGDSGAVTAAELRSGASLPCDMVVVGVGAKPNVEIFEGKLDLLGRAEGGGIAVDSKLRASAPGVFAAGDVAAFPLSRVRGGGAGAGAKQRQEHVLNCRLSAAHAMACAMSPDPDECGDYDYVPYFYSRVFGLAWVFHGFSTPLAGDSGTVECTDFGDRAAGKFGCLWVDTSTGKALASGVFLEGGSPEENKMAADVAKKQPEVTPEQIEGVKKAGAAGLGALLE